jgi:hypothetical protein
MDIKFEDQIGHIRTVKGWKVALHREQIWLKGPLDSGKDQILIHSLPITSSYELDVERRLFPIGQLTPIALLEELDWKPITDFLPVEMPVSALPGIVESRMPIRLIRTTAPKGVYALLTSFAGWKVYVESAPLIRLRQLSFALSASQEVLVVGEPLPTLPGKSYWRNGNLLLPSGYDFDPPFIANLLNNHFKTEKSDFILFKENGEWTSVSKDCLKQANRAVVRLLEF